MNLGEMVQTMYVHMNKFKTKEKKEMKCVSHTKLKKRNKNISLSLVSTVIFGLMYLQKQSETLQQHKLTFQGK
jgi:hypothetical protein